MKRSCKSAQPLNRLSVGLARGQRGVTGLETAIILIAFVVVASVFAFTVLSTGIFSAERGKETIHAGLREARSSLEIKGSVVAEGVANNTLSSGDAVWTTDSPGTYTVTTDATDKKEGTGSADIVIAASSTTGLAAYQDLTPSVDLSSIDSIQMWVKAVTSTTATEIQISLDDTAACGSTLENINIPALVANTWTLVTMAIADNSDMTAVQCVGLTIATDTGSNIVNVDNVFGQGQANFLLVTLTNALEGEPIDITEPGDSDANGVSDSDSLHTLILTYSDKNQVVRDVYWTRTFVGNNDSDHLLEAGEKVELRIRLSGLANTDPVVGDTKFQMEVRPEDGGVAVIERTMPDNVDIVMNLN